MRKTIIVLSLMVAFLIPGTIKAQTSKGLMKDSLALVAFYNNTKGSRYWSSYRKWEGKPIRRWYGVRVDRRNKEDRVVSITLKGSTFSYLEGKLPSQLGNLEYLEYLYLNSHKFDGPVPVELGNLINIKTLIIESSGLNGKMPSSFKNLEKVETLSFFKNRMTGNPLSTVSNMKSLKFLFLNNNKFSGDVPATVNNLKSIETLNIGHNKFTGDVYQSLKNCKSLSRLDVSDNPHMKTKNLVFNIDNFPKMNNLDMDNTIINAKMQDFKKVNKNLIYVDLDSTGLKGDVPEIIDNFPNLNEFYCAYNEVTGLPNLGRLREIGATDNRLEFDDIEKNLTCPMFHYSPQADVYNKIEVTAREGSNVILHAKIGGTANVYQWRKGMRRVDIENNEDYTIENLNDENAGKYGCTIRNTLATRAAIGRKTVKVKTMERQSIGDDFPITINGDIGYEGAKYLWSNGSKRPQTTFNSGDTLRLTITIGKDVTIEEAWIVERPWFEVPPKPDKIITFKNVLFERGRTNMISGQKELDKLAKMLNAYPDVRIMVMGHTDNQGDPRKNMVLSDNRTKVIKKYLQDQGIKSYRISTKGYGDTLPKYSNLKEETRRLNRRVEFKVVDPTVPEEE